MRFYAEREYLVKYVFPELREICLQWRIHFVDIDLRWGITKEAMNSGQVLEHCLESVEKAYPFFIGLLGDRYGMIPSEEDWALMSSRTIEKLKTRSQIEYWKGQSVTSLEIQYGALKPDLNLEPPEAFFYFREGQKIPREEPYFYPEQQPAIDRLKKEIYNKFGAPPNYNQSAEQARIFTYMPEFNPDRANPEDDDLKGRITEPSLYALGQRVLADLKAAIETVYSERIAFIREHRVIDSSDRELNQQEAFIAQRTQHFIGRQQLLELLLQYSFSDENQVQLVYGAPGSGKSALLSQLFNLLTASERNTAENLLIIPHFVGASPSSTSLPQMLFRICTLLQRTFDLTTTLSVDLNELIQRFHDLLGRIDRRVIIIVDAVNQFDQLDDTLDYTWIPTNLKANAKIIISTSDDATLDLIRSRTQLLKEVSALTPDEQDEIIRTKPNTFAKTLDADQRDLLRKHKRSIENPLWLCVALEGLRVFGSFEKLNNKIVNLKDDVEGLFIQLIEELENKYRYAGSVVPSFFCLLACSRFGLTEKELEALLQDDTEKIHKLLIQHLRPLLQYRETALGFHHPSLASAVVRKYNLVEEGLVWYERLTRYFLQQPLFLKSETNTIPNVRKVLELPWLLIRSGDMWAQLEEVLCDLWFLDAKIQSDFAYDLLNDYKYALRVMLHKYWPNEFETNRPASIGAFVANLAACASGHATTVPRLLSYDFSREEENDSAKSGRGSTFEHLRIYEQFVEANLFALRLGSSFPHHVFQVAFNSAKAGPIVMQATRVFREAARDTIRGTYLLNRIAFKENFSALNLLKRSIASPFEIGPLKITADGTHAVVCTHTYQANLVLVSSLEIWNLILGKCRSKFFIHNDLVTSLDITPDGTKAVTASMGPGPVKVWDLETTASLGQLQLRLDWNIVGVSITADGHMVYAATLDGDLITWNWSDNTHKRASIPARIVQFTADSIGKTAIVLAQDGSLSTFDLDRMQVAGRLSTKQPEPIDNPQSTILSDDIQGLRVLSDHLSSLKRQINKLNSLRLANTLSITPDGRYAVFNCDENRVWVFEVARLKVIFDLKLDGPNLPPRRLKLTADGRYLIVAEDGFKIYDLWSGKCERVIRHRLAACHFFDCTPDGAFLLTDFEYYALNWWNIQTSAVPGRKHYHAYNSVAFDPTGEFLCVTYPYNEGEAGSTPNMHGLAILLLNVMGQVVQEIRLTTKHLLLERPLVEFLDKHELLLLLGKKMIRIPFNEPADLKIEAGSVGHWVVNSNKDKVLYSTEKNELHCWDIKENVFSLIRVLESAAPRVVKHDFPEHPVLAVSSDGRTLVSGHVDGYIALWDLPSGKMQTEFRAYEGPVTAIALSGRGLSIISGNENGEVLAWSRGGILTGSVQAHQARITSLACGGSDDIFVSSALEGVIKFWDLARLTLRGTLDLGQVYVRQIDFSEAAATLVYSTDKGRIGVFNLAETYHCILEEGVPETNNPFMGIMGMLDPQMSYGLSGGGLIPITLSKSGKTIVAGENGLRVKLWKNLGGRWVDRLLVTGAHLQAVCLLDDDHLVLATCGRMELFHLNIPMLNAPIRQRFYHSSPIPNMSFYQIAAPADGTVFVTANDHQTIRKWDRAVKAPQELKKPLHLPEKPTFIPAYFFTNDSRQSIVRTADGKIEFVDLSTGAGQPGFLGEYALHLELLGTTPQQKKIIATTPENTVKIWDSHSGALLATLCGHEAEISQWATPSEDRLLTCDRDGVTKIWDLETFTCLASTKGILREKSFGNDYYFITVDVNFQQLFLWDSKTAQCLQTLPVGTIRTYSDIFRDRSVVVTGGNTLDLYEIVSIGETDWELPIDLFAETLLEVGPPPIIQISLDDYPVPVGPVTPIPTPDEKTMTTPDSPLGEAIKSPTPEEATQAFGEMLDYLRTGKIPSRSSHGSASRPITPQDSVIKSKNISIQSDAPPDDGLMISIGHFEPIYDVQFSPDGKYVASAGGDQIIKLWNVESGRLLRNFKANSGIVHAIDISPDGKYIISGNHDNTLTLWEIETSKVLKIYSGHTGVVVDVKFLTDGKRFVSSSFDTTIKIWDVEQGRVIFTFFGHKEPVLSLAFNVNKSIVASGSRDGTIHVWNLEDGELLNSINLDKSIIHCLSFSPAGDLLIAGLDGSIRLWNALTWIEIYTINLDSINVPFVPFNKDAVYSVLFSPDGAHFVTGSWSKPITVWETKSGIEVKVFDKGQRATLAHALSFSPDGQFLASGNSSKFVMLWDTNTSNIVHEFGERLYSINTCSVSPDGKYLISGHGDRGDGGQVNLWEIESGRILHSIKKIDKIRAFSSEPVNSVCFAPTGKMFATDGGLQGGVVLYDLTASLIKKIEWAYVKTHCINFNYDGSLLCACSRNNENIAIWSVADGSKIKMIQAHSKGISHVQFSPDGSKIISKGSFDNQIILWDIASGERIWTLNNLILSDFIQFSADGNTVLTCGEGIEYNKIKLRRVSDGGIIKSFNGHSKQINCAIFCSNNYIISGDSDNKIIVWNLQTGQMESILDKHIHQITSLSNIGDTPFFVSASKDGTMRIWELGNEKEAMTLYSFVNSNSSMAITPDGKYSTNANASKLLHYVEGMEVVALPENDPNFSLKLLPFKSAT